MGPEFSSHSSYFNDIFLRILEERGESGSGIYRTVLRDSSEFRFLSGMFIKDDMQETDISIETVKEEAAQEAPPVRLTLRGILADKKVSIADYGMDEWERLAGEYFDDIKEEKELVKNSSSVLNRITRREDCRDYHILYIVQYVFGRLNSYKKIEITSKEYAMKLMNMVSDKGETWNRLHREYLEIIKKK